MREFAQFLDNAQRKHGDKFDTSSLDAADSLARTYFRGPRVVVESVYEDGTTHRRAGVVSVTTGWCPSFLLMHRVSDHGSWDILGPNDKVVAIQRQDGKYIDAHTRKIVLANLGYTE